MKGTNMTCEPLGARDPFPPGSPVMEVLLLSPCYRWGNKLGEVTSLAQVTQQYKASLGCLFVCFFLLCMASGSNTTAETAENWRDPEHLPRPSPDHGVCCQPLRTKAMQPAPLSPVLEFPIKPFLCVFGAQPRVGPPVLGRNLQFLFSKGMGNKL